MSEFWTKTCERCNREFDVGLWTYEAKFCSACQVEVDLDPTPELFQGQINEAIDDNP